MAGKSSKPVSGEGKGKLLEKPKEEFIFGIKGLDSLLGKVLKPGTTLLIAGHPGAGKTTFAATICYHNALREFPCLYLSFQETKDKFINQMRSFGMNFIALENRGLFKFMRLPIIVSDEIVHALSEAIGDELRNSKFRTLVIDSATPISEALSNQKSPGRSVFQNFFYDLTRTLNGLVVLVEELPLGMITLPNRDIEFIADAMILMKHEIRESLLVRKMEFRKFRGAPLTVAEVPFSIREEEGIEAFVPRPLEEIPPVEEIKPILFPCKAFEKALGNLYSGMSMLISYPPQARSFYYGAVPLMALIILNDLNVGIISYRYSRNEILGYLKASAEELEIPWSIMRKAIKFIRGINPTAYSPEELVHIELSIIEKFRPSMIIFHSPEVILGSTKDEGSFYRLLYNQLIRLRALNILTIRLTSVIQEEEFLKQASLAEAVLRINYIRKGSPIRYARAGLEPEIYVWRTGHEPKIMEGNTLFECFREMKFRVREKCKKLLKEPQS